jgi:hypothetical protein
MSATPRRLVRYLVNPSASGGSQENLEIRALVFSRDGSYLAVATRHEVEIRTLPDLILLRSIRHVDLLFCEAEFNHGCDKYLTVSYDIRNRLYLIQVWITLDGVCVASCELPSSTSAHWLVNDQILYLVPHFASEPKYIEAVTLNISTGEQVRSAICARDSAYSNLLWAYIEADHAVIVAHIKYIKNSFTTIVGRWNLRDEAYEWQKERDVRFYKMFYGSVGRRVAVYGADAIDILCAVSGNSLRTITLAGCCVFFRLGFLPGRCDTVVFTWLQRPGYGNWPRNVMSAHNFLTNERTWEIEVDCGGFAVQDPMFTVLM